MYKIILFFWLEISLVGGLYTVLKTNQLEKSYSQVFNWFVSPLYAINGILFIKFNSKKQYSINLTNKLLLK